MHPRQCGYRPESHWLLLGRAGFSPANISRHHLHGQAHHHCAKQLLSLGLFLIALEPSCRICLCGQRVPDRPRWQKSASFLSPPCFTICNFTKCSDTTTTTSTVGSDRHEANTPRPVAPNPAPLLSLKWRWWSRWRPRVTSVPSKSSSSSRHSGSEFRRGIHGRCCTPRRSFRFFGAYRCHRHTAAPPSSPRR